MLTQSELDDVPLADKSWLKPLPRHLHATAVAVSQVFELQPARFRRFTRRKLRVWIVAMEHRAWLVEAHNRRQRGDSLFLPGPGDKVLIDAAARSATVRHEP